MNALTEGKWKFPVFKKTNVSPIREPPKPTPKKCFYMESNVKVYLSYKEIERMYEFINQNSSDDYVISLERDSGIGQGVEIADNYDMVDSQNITDYELW